MIRNVLAKSYRFWTGRVWSPLINVKARLRFFLQGVRCGSGLKVEGTVRVANGQNVELGQRVSLGLEVYLGALARGRVRIGANSYIGRFTTILAYEEVTIGNDCLIAPGCHITDVNHGFASLDEPMRTQPYTSKKVVIEDDVWFGAGVSVLPGVTIGKGSIIGARAVVSKSIPPYSIAFGVPAKVYRSRLPQPDSLTPDQLPTHA